MAVKFGTVETTLEKHGVKMLVYAGPGYGKTVLGLTMPGRKAYITAENGLLSLSKANQLRMFGQAQDVLTMQIESLADFKEAYAYVSGPGLDKYDSLVIDSETEIARKILAEKLAIAKDPRQAYGATNEAVSRYMRFFRDLPGKHVLMIAQLDKMQDETGKIMYGPSMPGKTLEQEIGHYPDEVFYLGLHPKNPQGVSERFLRCHPDITYMAKDRSGALNEFEPAILWQVIQKIQAL